MFWKKQVVSLETCKPKLLPPQTHVTAEKKKDVQDLLKFVKVTEEKKVYDDILKTVTKSRKQKNDLRTHSGVKIEVPLTHFFSSSHFNIYLKRCWHERPRRSDSTTHVFAATSDLLLL